MKGGWADTEEIAGENTVEVYVKCLYFVMMSMTSIGYGDILPVTENECVAVDHPHPR